MTSPRLLARALSVVFVLAVGAYLLAYAQEKPRVLIVHSYQTDYSWVHELDEGLLRTLDRRRADCRWFYMDAKKHTSDEYLTRTAVSVQRIIDSWQPDVIVLFDDKAQERVGTMNLDGPARIVFAGVGERPEKYGYVLPDGTRHPRVTGILERIPADAVESAIHTLFADRPGPVRVLIPSDASETALANSRHLEEHPWNGIQVTSVAVADFPSWQRELRARAADADLLLFTNYHSLEKDATSVDDKVPAREVVEWTLREIDLPTLGCWMFHVEDGGAMAVAVSGYEQGEVAGTMTMAILRQVEAGIEEVPMPPILETKQFVIGLREAPLLRHHLHIDPLWRAFAKAENTYHAR